MTENNSNVKNKIDKIETTDDCLSSRAGLALVARYIKSMRICHILSNLFSFIKKSSKGTGLLSLFHQLICFFFDGSNFHLTHFNDLAKDGGYEATIETSGKYMASSHTIKRFFQAISKVHVWLFRKVLQQWNDIVLIVPDKIKTIIPIKQRFRTWYLIDLATGNLITIRIASTG